MFKKIFILLIFPVNCVFSQLWIAQSPGVYFTANSVSAVDNNICWICGGSSQVLRTTNGGANWDSRNLNVAGLNLHNIFGIDALNALCAGNVSLPTNPTNIYKTTDGGVSWTLVFSQLNAAFIHSIWMTSNSNGIMMGDPAGGRWTLFRTTNGGSSWDSTGLRLNALAGERGVDNGMIVIGSNIWFIACGGTINYGRIFYSSNSGLNWTIQSAQMPRDLPIGGNIWFNSATSGIGMAVTSDSTSYFSTTNGGTTWNTISIGATTGGDIAYHTGNGTNLWKAVYQSILMSTNNGITWSSPQYTLPVGNFVHIQKARNGNIAWAIDYAGTTDGIVKGNITPPPAAVLVSPPNGATGQSLTPTLDWNDLSGPVRYSVQVATDSNFNSNLVNASALLVSQYTIGSGILQNNVTYYWRVRGESAGGFGAWSPVWRFTPGPTGINIYSSEIPKEFKLYNIYPNPFNPSARIKFDIPERSLTKIIVYDVTGRVHQHLVSEILEAGRYEIEFNGSGYSSGVYFYSIISNKFSQTKKMIILK